MRARPPPRGGMTGGSLILLLAVIAALASFSALFSGLETALFSLKAHQLRRLEDQHPSLQHFIQAFRDKPRRVLNVLLLGDAIVNMPLVVLCLFVVWEGPLAAVQLPQWLAAIAIFALVVLLCDLIPKLIALSAPYRLSAIGVFTLRALMPLLEGVGSTLETISQAIVGKLTPAQATKGGGISDEELETLLEMGQEEGALHEAEGEMIQEIIKLGDKTAKDCMTPRVDTFSLPDDLKNEEAIAQIQEKRHRRIPVYAETPDQVLGILDVKRFLLDPSDHYTEYLIAPSFVPETMRAPELLRGFLSHPQGLAVVVDEFGGVEGIITRTDIVEEIMSDAAPIGQADLYIEPLEDGRFLVSGNARLDDLTEHLGFELEADGIDTIGGFVFNRLGYLPPSGTQVELPRLLIHVRRTARKRIEEMLIEKTTWLPEDERTEDDRGADES
ncbi:MAG: HlyC/CorC family transporter [Chthoniobacterales bacterium]|nr:HlyC/CorC family transporter [Chthoniobacterales bacterium]